MTQTTPIVVGEREKSRLALDDSGTPVPGLYGVGNCVASPSAQAYRAGGATLGPIIAFAYRAAQAADRKPIREPRPLAATPS